MTINVKYAKKGLIAGGNSAPSMTIANPMGTNWVVAGDKAIILIMARYNDLTQVTSPGWTKVEPRYSDGTSFETVVMEHVLSADDPATFTFTASQGYWSANVYAGSGIGAFDLSSLHTYSPIDIALTEPGELVISAACFYRESDTLTIPPDFIEVGLDGYVAGVKTGGYKLYASAGNQTVAYGGHNPSICVAYAFEPAASTNTPPVANDQSITVNEDGSFNGTLVAVDADNDPLTYSLIVVGEGFYAAHGTATITDASTGAFSYTPDAGYTGADSFQWSVSDGTASASAIVSITVQAVVHNLSIADLAVQAGIDQPTLAQTQLLGVADAAAAAYANSLSASQAQGLAVANAGSAAKVAAVKATATQLLQATDAHGAATVETTALHAVQLLHPDNADAQALADAVAATVAQRLGVASAAAKADADTAAVTQTQRLAPADAAGAATLDTVSLASGALLAIQNLAATGVVDAARLSQTQSLAVDNATASPAIDAAGLRQLQRVVALAVNAPAMVESVALAQSQTLSVANAEARVSLDTLALMIAGAVIPPAQTMRLVVVSNPFRLQSLPGFFTKDIN